ncbi:MAG: MerR family transcriptional regulator [Acidimicrobiales bacterium]
MGVRSSRTVDELAATVGVPTRTVRYWQSLGLVPPPWREGRIARYGDEHLRRVRLVTVLADRGVRLEAMPRLVELLEQGGDSLREWLGIADDEVLGTERPVAEDRQVRLPADELVRRFGGRTDVLKGLARMHVARPEGDGAWVVPSDALLELALRIDRLGVDVETAVGAEAILRHHLRALAEDLVAWFEACLPPPESTRAAWARLGALRPIGADAARLLFWQELTRAFRRRAQRPHPEMQPVALPSWLRWVLGRRIPFPAAGTGAGASPALPAT